MREELRDYPGVLKFISGMGFQVPPLSTVAKVADVHVLTEEEARNALVDLGLIFIAMYPEDARKCMTGLAILRQGDPEDGA